MRHARTDDGTSPSGSPMQDEKKRRVSMTLLKDPRQAVKSTPKISSPPLKPLNPEEGIRGNPPRLDLGKPQSMPSLGMARLDSRDSSSSTGGASPSFTDPGSEMWPCGCLGGVFSKLGALLGSKGVEDSSTPAASSSKCSEPARRWYRVHPISDELYHVRPDAGIAGRTFGHPDAAASQSLITDDQPDKDNKGETPVSSKLRERHRQNSVPKDICLMPGLADPGFNDSFSNLCKLCYDRPAEVVLLPCRHGGMCEACLRKALFMKPKYRGGHSCPMCRKKIMEVIKMYDNSTVKMYGYAISAGCFFEGKDDN